MEGLAMAVQEPEVGKLYNFEQEIKKRWNFPWP